MSLSDVTILITAGHRPGYLDQALLGIQANLPECTVVVATDDGHRGFSKYHLPKVIWTELPYDSFLTKKRNEGVKLIDTKYTLMAADDFDFTSGVRAAAIKMSTILNSNWCEVIGGTYQGRHYEGFLTYKEGEYISETMLDTNKEKPVFDSPYAQMWKVDLTTNWFMAKTYVLQQYPWDESIGPIGGEHGDWFLTLKENYVRVGWTPGLEVWEQPKNLSMEQPYYRQMRARAWETGHRKFLQKRNIQHYYGFNEVPPK